MAALDFPASPSNGQTYTGPGGVVWTWDGSKWVTQGIATAYLPLAGGAMTGPLQLIPGSVTAAALRFDITANTGLYGAAGSVGIATSGTARLTVNDTGVLSTVPITLPGAPTLPLNAATKGYVDGFLPLTGGILTGDLTVSKASPIININKPASGQNAAIGGQTNGVYRWSINLGDSTAESANAGSNFTIGRFNDAGTYIDAPFSITRSDGYLHVLRGFGDAGFGPGSSQVDNAAVKTVGSYGGAFLLMDGAGRCGIWCDGNGANFRFGVGSSTSLTQAAYFTSAATYNASGSWVSFSDAALKEAVQPYTRGLADLVQLRPVSFVYARGTPFADPDETPRIGLIAQEVEPYVPEIVGQVDATIAERTMPVQTLESGALIYAVINSLKEIEARLVQLEGAPVP